MGVAPLRVLIVDESNDDAELIARAFRRVGLNVEWIRVDEPDKFANALRAAEQWDVILWDTGVPRFGYDQIVAMAHAVAPSAPTVLVTGHRGPQLEALLADGTTAAFVSKEHLEDVPVLVYALTRRRPAAGPLAQPTGNTAEASTWPLPTPTDPAPLGSH